MPGSRARPAATAGALAAALGTTLGCGMTLGTAGCATSAVAGQSPLIGAATAYVPVPVSPGITTGYLVMRNNGTRPDSLVSVRTSAGGRVSFRVPAGRGAGMRTETAIGLPPHTTVRLVPDGPHLLISGIGRVQNGKVITLTLRFRHAGPVQVPALVTNPSQTSGNGNYFMN